MTLKFVLAALLSLPTFHRDPSGPAKERQMLAIAESVAKEAQTRDEAAFLLVLGWHESAYSLDVHEGRCPPKMCDPDRNGVPRARSTWQLHRDASMTADTWARMHGVENTPLQAREAAKKVRWALRQCTGPARIVGAFRVLGGNGCSRALRGEAERVATFERVRRRM